MGIDLVGAKQVAGFRRGTFAAIGAIDTGLTAARRLAHGLHRQCDDPGPAAIGLVAFLLHSAQRAEANLVVGLDETIMHGPKRRRLCVG